jgi:hypothetical protein
VIGGLGCGGYEFYKAAGQRNATYDYQPSSNARFPIGVKGQPKSKPYQPNCEQPQNREDADLCAQWAAVSQATEANRLSSLSLQISIGAMVFTIIGTGLLIWTLQETRQSSIRELRAYVLVKTSALRMNPAGGGAEAHIVLVNGGQTPAYECCHAGNVVDVTDEEAEAEFTRRDERERLGRASPFTLQMGQEMNASIPAHKEITVDELKQVTAGDKSLYLFGIVFYKDTFGRDRTTKFCYRVEDLKPPSTGWGKVPSHQEISRSEWVMAPFHNDAT